jgi:hypothetical protein
MFLNSIKKLTPVPPLFFLKRGGEEDILLPFSFLEKGLGDELQAFRFSCKYCIFRDSIVYFLRPLAIFSFDKPAGIRYII